MGALFDQEIHLRESAKFSIHYFYEYEQNRCMYVYLSRLWHLHIIFSYFIKKLDSDPLLDFWYTTSLQLPYCQKMWITKYFLIGSNFQITFYIFSRFPMINSYGGGFNQTGTFLPTTWPNVKYVKKHVMC